MKKIVLLSTGKKDLGTNDAQGKDEGLRSKESHAACDLGLYPASSVTISVLKRGGDTFKSYPKHVQCGQLKTNYFGHLEQESRLDGKLESK